MTQPTSCYHRCESTRVCNVECCLSSAKCFPRTHRRARSAPPSISTVSGGNGRTGTGEGIGDEGQNCRFNSFHDMRSRVFDSCFCHASFDVIARNLPTHKLQELERLLTAFAASLKLEGSPSSHHLEPYKGPTYDTPQEKNSTYFPAYLDSCLKVTGEGTFSKSYTDMRHKRCLSCTVAREPTPYPRYELSNENQPLPQLADGDDSWALLARSSYNTSHHRRGSRQTSSDSGSSSSVDFLHFARQKNPATVRLLEEEYDKAIDSGE